MEVTVLDNLSSPSPLGVPEGVDFHHGDVIDPPALAGRFDRIYHLASPASPPRYLTDPVGTLRTGAEGTRNMLERASRDGALFLLASTSEVYGDPEVHPQVESYQGSVQVTSTRACYDEAKRYAEALTYAFNRTGRVAEVRVARIFNTYGPGMDPEDGRVVSNFFAQAIRGEPLTLYGDGSQTRSFCYLDDLIEGLIRMADSGLRGPVNIGNPHEVTVAELADRVAALAGDTGREHRPLPDHDPARRKPDISVATAELGWSPTVSLEEGLRLTHPYFRELLDG